MNVTIDKKELIDIIWLQKEIEAVLERETLKRGKAKGLIEEKDTCLFQLEVDSLYGEICVSYTSVIEENYNHHKKGIREYEYYTLAESLRLAMMEGTDNDAKKD